MDGVIPLSVAVVLHEGSTIVVVLNALRLLAWHEPAITTDSSSGRFGRNSDV